MRRCSHCGHRIWPWQSWGGWGPFDMTTRTAHDAFHMTCARRDYTARHPERTLPVPEKQKNELGPTGETVMTNIKRTRESKRITFVELANRLTAMERPIPVLGLRRIERGERRVDVDDLFAIAAALEVSPLILLLPSASPDGHAEATGLGGATVWEVWKWVEGPTPERRRKLLYDLAMIVAAEGVPDYDLISPVATIARRVRELRGRRGWSAAQLGDVLHKYGVEWDRFTVASLESGKRQNVTVRELLALALALDVAPVNLLVPLENQPYLVTPTRIEGSDNVRAWVRGQTPLPGVDERTFLAEVSIRDLWEQRSGKEPEMLAELAKARAPRAR